MWRRRRWIVWRRGRKERRRKERRTRTRKRRRRKRKARTAKQRRLELNAAVSLLSYLHIFVLKKRSNESQSYSDAVMRYERLQVSVLQCCRLQRMHNEQSIYNYTSAPPRCNYAIVCNQYSAMMGRVKVSTLFFASNFALPLSGSTSTGRYVNRWCVLEEALMRFFVTSRSSSFMVDLGKWIFTTRWVQSAVSGVLSLMPRKVSSVPTHCL
mmetsp:Transcript_19675/g.43869  ORF Transcript_19675/g.43869 Transcript_19675/m.43869 type:complete len:211 (+) Transcript_19675:1249-1881(+)